MVVLTPPSARITRIVFVIGFVCLIIIFAGMVLVAARNDDDPPFVTISGQVTENTVGLSGVTIGLGGSQVGIRTTDSSGFYSFDVPSGGSYTLTPLTHGFAFDPPGYTFNNLTTSRVGNFAANRQILVVTNAHDQGPGSFRDAITTANANTGKDTITFNIPGAGVKVITLLTPLPEITDPVVIGADTQPGYAGAPLIELDGTNAGSDANGLVITAGGSIVRGLAIGGFQSAGIVLRSGNGNIIQGNYIGVDATGTVARPNTNGIHIPDSKKNLIGGDTAGAGNLISGNDRGIFALLVAQENTIQGNLIGTDITGTHKIGNGIGIHAQAAFTLIGGLTPGARNIISGNGTGVIFGEPQSKLQGNFIGTDITGTVALGNTSSGVIVDQGGLIGGTASEARNVISGNGSSNISMGSSFVDALVPIVNTVQGNYIGTDVTGSRPLTDPDLSTTRSGIFIFGFRNDVDAQNVISGNAVGIRIGSIDVPTLSGGNSIFGNLIGLNAAGTGPVPNTEGGIDLSLAIGNQIGSNKIAFNGGPGVMVSAGSSRNSIVNNSIFSNDGLGIDLGNDGVTANDPEDTDVGPNHRQNFPVLTSVVSTGNSTTIHASLNSTPNTSFRIDFYSSAALDPSGNGEGALFLGTQSVTTNGNGDAIMIPTFPVALGVGRVVTATATDPNENTSEFSAGDVAGAAGNVQFSVDSMRVLENIGPVTITVLRKGGSSGNLTVEYQTIDGTAIGGDDYTLTSGTLTFSDGEVAKSFQVMLLDDGVTESDETFSVVLRNAASPEILGALNTLVITIRDHSTNELELLLEESGPKVDQAAALDALLFLRDPFHVAIPDWLAQDSDRNTRVMFFVRGLRLDPGELPSAVVVQVRDSNNHFFNIEAEDVRAVPNSDFVQVVIRLPDDLTEGTQTVTVFAHFQSSNSGTIRIAP